MNLRNYNFSSSAVLGSFLCSSEVCRCTALTWLLGSGLWTFCLPSSTTHIEFSPSSIWSPLLPPLLRGIEAQAKHFLQSQLFPWIGTFLPRGRCEWSSWQLEGWGSSNIYKHENILSLLSVIFAVRTILLTNQPAVAHWSLGMQLLWVINLLVWDLQRCRHFWISLTHVSTTLLLLLYIW